MVRPQVRAGTVLDFGWGTVRIEDETRTGPYEEGRTRIGRDREFSEIAPRIEHHDTVSREHAELGRGADGALWVRDVGSRNGTYVNTRRIESGHRTRIRIGDEIVFGTDLRARVEAGTWQ